MTFSGIIVNAYDKNHLGFRRTQNVIKARILVCESDTGISAHSLNVQFALNSLKSICKDRSPKVLLKFQIQKRPEVFPILPKKVKTHNLICFNQPLNEFIREQNGENSYVNCPWGSIGITQNIINICSIF